MSIRNVNLELERSPVGLGIRKVDQRVKYSDFTDSTGTTGTLTLKNSIPAGAFVLGTKVTVETGFTGNTSCTLKVGKSSGEDEYTNGSTVNIYTAADVGAEAEDFGAFNASAQSVYLVATAGTDWSLVTAGQLYIEIFYLSTEPEITDKYTNKWKP